MVLAQDNSGNPGGGGRGRGNFDPAQFQQRMMDNIKERLAFTNDTDWAAVQPLVQKVLDARAKSDRAAWASAGLADGAVAAETMHRRTIAANAFFQPSPEAEALQKAIDDKAPTAQVKAALEKYRAARKDKEAKLAASAGGPSQGADRPAGSASRLAGIAELGRQPATREAGDCQP